MWDKMHYASRLNFFSPEQAAVPLLPKRYAADAKSFIQELVILLQSAPFSFPCKDKPSIYGPHRTPAPCSN